MPIEASTNTNTQWCQKQNVAGSGRRAKVKTEPLIRRVRVSLEIIRLIRQKKAKHSSDDSPATRSQTESIPKIKDKKREVSEWVSGWLAGWSDGWLVVFRNPNWREFNRNKSNLSLSFASKVCRHHLFHHHSSAVIKRLWRRRRSSPYHNHQHRRPLQISEHPYGRTVCSPFCPWISIHTHVVRFKYYFIWSPIQVTTKKKSL